MAHQGGGDGKRSKCIDTYHELWQTCKQNETCNIEEIGRFDQRKQIYSMTAYPVHGYMDKIKKRFGAQIWKRRFLREGEEHPIPNAVRGYTKMWNV